jgi:hypothetical protein
VDISADRASAFQIFVYRSSRLNGEFLIGLIIFHLSEKLPLIDGCSSQAAWTAADDNIGRKTRKCTGPQVCENHHEQTMTAHTIRGTQVIS